ncbi:hypothetical protein AB9K26_04835 [Psychroserpens sp. XS_ASV72]|uniref:hypothetical protein n=1 Tax=Psychroserpens sp. XS_ASV72 TaxID=3241293 RepID=UPI0035122EBD
MSEIQQKIQHAIALDFGEIFNESIELFKKSWVQGLIIVLLTFALSIPFIAVIYIPMIAFGILGESNPNVFEDVAPLIMIVFFVIFILMMLFLIVISLGLKAAFFRILYKFDMNTNEKEDYFFFLRRPYLMKTINLSLAYLGITLLAAILCYLPLFYVLVPLNLLLVVYAFNPDLTVSNLVKLSFELGNKKWLITFGLIFVCSFLAQIVGFLMCGVGILVTASFVSIPLYFIYKKVIGFEPPEYTQIQGNQNF